MPSSFTPKSIRRSWISCARARSASEKTKVFPLARGSSHSSSIQLFSVGESRCDRVMNSWISISHSHRLPRTVGHRLPLGDECFEFRIRLFGAHQHQLDIFIALAAVRTWRAASLKPENATGVRPFWYRHRHRSGGSGNLDLGAQYRLLQGNRQIQIDVIPSAREVGMRQHGDLDQRVARRGVSNARPAFALEAQNLAVSRPRRNVDVQRGPIGEDDGLLAAIDRIEKRKIEVIAAILAPPPTAGGAALATEDLRKNVFAAGEFAEIGKA